MDFINKAILKHGDKYDYSAVCYVNSGTKVTIICKEHGKFSQNPSKHLQGQGCPFCAGNVKDTKCSFVKKAESKHGNKYDYSKVNYVNCDTKVVIKCPKHGVFEQTPYAHLNSCGCIECAKELAPINRRKYSSNDFVDRCFLVHGNKYDYSKVEYLNESTKVEIICKIHGSFWQSPSEHITRKQGCKECGYNKMSNKLIHTYDSFIEESNKRHNNKYDYSKVTYNGYFEEVTIICPKHGEFYQLPRDHINYCGCQKCGSECIISNGQKEIIEFINQNVDDDILINNREIIKPYEIDIFIPSIKLGIEYNGLYWHSYNRKENRCEIMKHSEKVDIANDNGIRLIHVFENQWYDCKDLIKSILLNKIGLSNTRIYARRCIVVEIDNLEFKDFCDFNHVDGSVPTNVKLGLYYQNRLVCVMGFNKHNKYQWEVSRLASSQNVVVVGGASKLFKYFIKKYHPNTVMTYANRCYSDGSVYKNLGFNFLSKTKPNYKYVKSGSVYSRQQFQKHKLSNKLKEFDPVLSESENMFNNGFRRIWDCGNLKFLWTDQTYCADEAI